MAGRILNRPMLREQAESAEAGAPDATPAKAPPRATTKKTAAPSKKPRTKKAPPRMRARWGVVDVGMKQVAVFDYNQRPAADAKVADQLAKKKSMHFLQLVNEPMPEPEPLEAAPLA